MTIEKFAQMLNCNLAKSIHNNWLQVFGNKGGNLYVAIIDDYIRTFLQVMAYHQFLKGGVGGVGLSKEKLKLRCVQRSAQRTSDPVVMRKILLDMPNGDKFCTCNPHLEGGEVFGPQKHKSDTPIVADEETHCPNIVNFPCPHITHRTTRSQATPLSTIVKESSLSMLEVAPPPPIGLDFCLVTVVQESKVDEKLWHIAHIPYNSSKACWAMHTVTKKKCTTKIVTNGKSTPAPTYLGVWNYYKFTTPKVEKFFFCQDDIKCCVKGSRRKWVDKFSVDQVLTSNSV